MSEFDEKAVKKAANEYVRKVGRMNFHQPFESGWLEGARWQWEKDRAEIERIKQDMNLAVSNAGKDLIAERDKMSEMIQLFFNLDKTMRDINHHQEKSGIRLSEAIDWQEEFFKAMHKAKLIWKSLGEVKT